MNKELNIGDYVRTKEGIEKIICIEENFMDDNVTFYATDNDIWRSAYNGRYNGFTSRSDVIIKSSPNIIDLIEVGDYVNGIKVDFTNIKDKLSYEDKCIGFYDGDGDIFLFEEDIKSIVTKEQFESMEYKIGDKENE